MAVDGAPPLLLAARPGGARLAALVRGLALAWPPEAAPGAREGAAAAAAAAPVGDPAEAWAALRLLPHACESPEQARRARPCLRGAGSLASQGGRQARGTACGTEPGGRQRASEPALSRP